MWRSGIKSPLSAGRCVKCFEPIDASLIEHRRETVGTSNNDEMLGSQVWIKVFGSSS